MTASAPRCYAQPELPDGPGPAGTALSRRCDRRGRPNVTASDDRFEASARQPHATPLPRVRCQLRRHSRTRTQRSATAAASLRFTNRRVDHPGLAQAPARFSKTRAEPWLVRGASSAVNRADNRFHDRRPTPRTTSVRPSDLTLSGRPRISDRHRAAADPPTIAFVLRPAHASRVHWRPNAARPGGA